MKVLDFQQEVNTKRQFELTTKMEAEISKLNSEKRNVTPVLKLLVLDEKCDENNATILNVWKPAEDLLEMLREGQTFLVYNVFPRFVLYFSTFANLW